MNREIRRQREREERRADTPAGVDASEVGTRERSSPAQFLREVRAELKKVAWPTRAEVINYSIVVLVVTLALTLFVWGLDWVFREAITNSNFLG